MILYQPQHKSASEFLAQSGVVVNPAASDAISRLKARYNSLDSDLPEDREFKCALIPKQLLDGNEVASGDVVILREDTLLIDLVLVESKRVSSGVYGVEAIVSIGKKTKFGGASFKLHR